MAKHTWKVCDWIIYHNDGEQGRTIKCCAVGSQEASHAKGTVLRSFYGTYPEARAYVEELNDSYYYQLRKRRKADGRN